MTRTRANFTSLVCTAFLLSVVCYAAQERQKASRSGSPQNALHCLVINQFIWIWLFLTSFRAEVCEEQEWRVGLTYVPTTACIRCGASSRKRHGNRHAKPAGLRVPVRPNLRKFLVKCSTSGAFSSTFTRFSLVRPPQSY